MKLTSKQLKELYKIIISAVFLTVILLLFETELLSQYKGTWLEGLCLLIPYAIAGFDVFKSAIKGISHGQVFDENFLMIIAGIGAYCVGEYTEAVAVILFYKVGELFENYAVGKSRQSISDMMSICPEYANLETEAGISQVDPDDVEIGSIIVIKPGERIPLDAVIIEGESFVDTSALTGESVPRRVVVGEEVISGCINGNGILKCRTLKAYEDSTVSKILELVENASSKKSKTENFISKFARYYTPIVTGAAVLLAIVPSIITGDWAEWIKRACTFLVISCPCALVISVPLGFFGGIGGASKIGVLVKGSNYLEAVANVKDICFDKTGTLTKGEFKVNSIIPVGMSERELLRIAAHGESLSTHPIAQSILNAYGEPVDSDKLTEVTEKAGHGISAMFEGHRILIGNEKLMQTENIKYEVCTKAGTVCYVAVDDRFAGVLVISDTAKDGIADALESIRQAGVTNCIMLTGDREKAAESIAKEVGVDKFYSDLFPQDKVAKVEELINAEIGKAKLAFVGDGINDAPVLTRADVGIAMGSMGSDSAIEAADIVIMDDDIGKIASLIRIARKTLGIVKQNIVFALFVKAVILVLGALGIANMWAAVFADVGVAVIAILNSMRTLSGKA